MLSADLLHFNGCRRASVVVNESTYSTIAISSTVYVKRSEEIPTCNATGNPRARGRRTGSCSYDRQGLWMYRPYCVYAPYITMRLSRVPELARSLARTHARMHARTDGCTNALRAARITCTRHTYKYVPRTIVHARVRVYSPALEETDA